MTSQGHAYARFQRALASRNPAIAWAAAIDVGHLDLADALELCLLIKDEPERYARAAVRWHVRYCTEVTGVGLSESQLVLAALTALPRGAGATAAADALARLAEERGLATVARTLDRWAG